MMRRLSPCRGRGAADSGGCRPGARGGEVLAFLAHQEDGHVSRIQRITSRLTPLPALG